MSDYGDLHKLENDFNQRSHCPKTSVSSGDEHFPPTFNPEVSLTELFSENKVLNAISLFTALKTHDKSSFSV